MNCAYFLCPEQLSSANKREEQSDERFKPTSFEQLCDMNVNPHKDVGADSISESTVNNQAYTIKKQFTIHSFVGF